MILNVKQIVMSAIYEGTNQDFERNIPCTHYSLIGICAFVHVKIQVILRVS